jgi:osmoprotectant transport system permease protein
MYMMLIRGHTDLDVAAKTGLGGTKICFDALTNKQIDLYPEYTGTGLLVILQSPLTERLRNKDSVYAFVSEQFSSRYRLRWLKPIGFNNAYALMMRREKAERLKLRTITGLTQFLNTQKK